MSVKACPGKDAVCQGMKVLSPDIFWSVLHSQSVRSQLEAGRKAPLYSLLSFDYLFLFSPVVSYI